MQTRREKIQLALIVFGIALTVGAAGAAYSRPKESVYRDSDGAEHFDGTIAGTLPKGVAPWLVGGGVAALFGAYLLRDK